MKAKLEEYNLKEIVSILFSYRKKIVGIVIGTFVLSVVIAFTTPEEYVTDMLIMPEIDQNQKSSSLLSSFGVGSLLSGGDNTVLNPLTYYKVLESIPFQEAALRQEFYFSNHKQSYVLEDYFLNVATPPLTKVIEKYTILLPFTIKRIFFPKEKATVPQTAEPSDIRNYSKDELELIQSLSERIELTFDEITGLMNIQAKMQDPIASAQYLEFAFEYLKSYVIKHKQEKAQNSLDFLSEQLVTITKRYKVSELELASYKDRNIVTSGNVRRIEQLRLENEFNLNSQLFNSFRQKVEEARIQLNDDKPIISVINPIAVPVEKDEPKRLTILVLGIMLGLFFAVAYVISVVYLRDVLSILAQSLSEVKQENDAP